MLEADRRQKAILLGGAGFILIFSVAWVLSRRMTGPETTSPIPTPTEGLTSAPDSPAPSSSLLMVESIPSDAWNLPALRVNIQDPKLAQNVSSNLSGNQPLESSRYVATSSLWVVRVQLDDDMARQIEVLPRLEPLSGQENESKTMTVRRNGLAYRSNERVYEASRALQDDLKEALDRWFGQALSDASPLSGEEKDQARASQTEYELLWRSRRPVIISTGE